MLPVIVNIIKNKLEGLAEKDIQNVTPGSRIAGLAAALSLIEGHAKNVIVFSCVQLVVSLSDNDASNAMDKLLGALHSGTNLKAYADGAMDNVPENWIQAESYNNLDAEVKDSILQSARSLLNMDLQDTPGIFQYIESERQSWEVFMLFREDDEAANPDTSVMQVLKKWTELLDPKRIQNAILEPGQVLPQQPVPLPPQLQQQLLGEMKLSNEWGRISNTLGITSLICEVFSKKGENIEKKMQKDPSKKSVDAMMLHVTNTYNAQKKKGFHIASGMTWSIMLCNQMAWTQKGSSVIFGRSARSFFSPCEVMALAKDTKNDIYMYVVWKVLTFGGHDEHHPTIENVMTSADVKANKVDGLQGAFRPRSIDVPASGISVDKLKEKELQLELVKVGPKYFRRLFFKDEWVKFDVRSMSRDVIFLVGSLPLDWNFLLCCVTDMKLLLLCKRLGSCCLIVLTRTEEAALDRL